ncbi:hypothetical protein N0O92_23395 [Alkalihalobacillus sp. MEB130]|uniref:hypothetical protein n=1 Tax=Alkalihalobacillus sp. MEB130 TaxID=2976704 RepID=UPI0028DE9703|nr:hypothetical protein [Alkalihalobacillus sp. MEB130]MDT8863088.1 hypothetical protein [Alkalihalobacillus sp. MEB130]
MNKQQEPLAKLRAKLLELLRVVLTQVATELYLERKEQVYERSDTSSVIIMSYFIV